MNDKIALYLVNGALGAGKTTLVDFLVQQPEFAGARVIENEFASESIDSCTLAQRVDEVATIAGECICCSSGEELIDILHNFAISGKASVIIESTGVANTLRVVEKLLAGDIFEQYDLKQSLYVVDGAEVKADGLVEALLAEAQAADVVLVSKLDLLTEKDRQQLIATLLQQGLTNVVNMDHGKFDLAQLASESRILDYLLLHEPAENAAENVLNYSVIDVSGLAISSENIKKIWASLRDKYALRRMKGAVADGNEIYHIEATPQQMRVTRGAIDESLKLVVIGERAREITRAVIMKELG
ncbi:MAG: GTP-binding protein [Candidatus Saccharimonas sp.]